MIIHQKGLKGFLRHLVNYLNKYMPECINETVDSNNAIVYDVDTEKVLQNICILLKKRELELKDPTVRFHRIDDPLETYFDFCDIPNTKIPPMYHGTDARIVRMSSEDIKRIKAKCEEALHYMWPFFVPLYDDDQDRLKSCMDFDHDPEEYLKLMDKLICCSGMHNGNENYQYKALYVTNDIERAKRFARRAYAFGEIGEVTYIMSEAAKKIKFEGWNPSEDITEILDYIKKFAEEDSEPVVIKLENLDPWYFEFSNGSFVPPKLLNLKALHGTICNFRYVKDITLDLNDSIKL